MSDKSSAFFDIVVPFTGQVEMEPTQMLTPVNAGTPMIQAKTNYSTAVAVGKPRNLDQVVKAVLREAEFAGDAFYYSFSMGGGKVEGASIGLAVSVAREWTNCAIPVDYQDTPTEWVFNAHFIDLERGFTISRVLRAKKGFGRFKKLGDKDPERATDMTFQAAQSRAIRNAILAGVPRWLVDQAVERAKQAVINGITREGIVAATDKALKFLSAYGVIEEQVVQYFGRPKASWGNEDIVELRGIASQLKDGQARAVDIFPAIEEKAAKPESKQSSEIRTDTAQQAEFQENATKEAQETDKEQVLQEQAAAAPASDKSEEQQTTQTKKNDKGAKALF